MSEVTIRKAVVEDGQAMAHLLKALGYPNTRLFCEGKIAALFPRPGLLGRIMALVIAEEARGCGVGRQLMASLETKARGAGCVMMEVTSDMQRHWAHTFYQKMGHQEEPRRFVKILD
jgi:GNAT superfamily N-acetyltransferase